MKIILLIFYIFLNQISGDLFAQAVLNNGMVEDNSELNPGENPDEKIRKNFFLKAEVSKKECYVGEPLMAVFKAYSRLDANSQVLKRPSLSGFSVIEMVDAYNNHPDVERYNGQNYFVHLIRKVQLFPLQPGSFIIEPAEVESIIHLRRGNRTKSIRNLRDLFRRSDNDASLDRQIVFQSPPLNVQVNALPQKDQPEDYAGAVGNFVVHLQMSDSAVSAREPNMVKLIISGTGNFPLVTEPHISWPASGEISGPTVSEQVNKYVYPLSGIKIYQFTIEHRDTGTFTIPPVKFSYFDPSSRSYKTAQSKELNYTVSPASEKHRDGQLVFRNEKQAPLHYYYFAGLALIIISLIIYFMLKPWRKAS